MKKCKINCIFVFELGKWEAQRRKPRATSADTMHGKPAARVLLPS